MAKIHLQTINVDDFLQGSLALTKPKNPQVLGSSAVIYVTKTKKGVSIALPQNEEGAFINNFRISLTPSENEENPNKFICDFNWDINKETTKYRLYKNNVIIKETFNNCAKYNFEEEKDGVYIFKIDCLQENNFISKSTNSNEYIYPFLNIPILLNYRYYFYYYIENIDKDEFVDSLLTPIAIDSRASYLINNNKYSAENINKYLFIDHIKSIPSIQNKGVFISKNSDDFISFTENDYSEAKNPPMYFILKLNKILGSRNNLTPIVKKIDIYVEQIDENDENVEIGGEL